MRRIVVAALAAAAIVLAATSGASAAPVSGAALRDATADPVIQAQWGHNARRSHWRWGSRGWHDPRRSHWRWGSRGRW